MSRNFNGSTDRIDWASAGNLSGAAFTLSAWVYADTNTGNRYILCNHDSGDAVYGLVVNLPAASEALDFVRHSTNASDRLWFETTGTVTTGAWHHIIITSDGGVLSGSVAMWVDGSSRALTFSDAAGTESAHTGKWSLGGRIYSDTRNFDGNIAEIAVWSSVLSSNAIATLARGYAPSLYPAGLLFYYSSKTDTLVAEAGGTGTADGSAYAASHPTISYSRNIITNFFG